MTARTEPATLQGFTGHAGGVLSVAVTRDGRTLLSGGEDETVRTWDGGVLSVAVTRDGRTLLSGGEDETVRTWDAGAGAPGHILSGHAGRVWSVKEALGQTAGS